MPLRVVTYAPAGGAGRLASRKSLMSQKRAVEVRVQREGWWPLGRPARVRTQERLAESCSTPLSVPVTCARKIASSCAPNRNAVVEM